MKPQPSVDSSVHLSDDALDDLLLEQGSAANSTHVATCAECATRLQAFQTTMSAFNHASSAWAQAKSNSISRELTPRKTSFAILPAWSVAAAFFLAVALSFLVGIHRGMTPQNDVLRSAIHNEAGDRQQEIASDNEMLFAIHTAISQPVPSPADVYGMKKTSMSSSRGNSSGEVSE